MSSLGTARWYLGADTLGLAHILVRARPDVTFPGDDGVRHKSRWTLPACIVQDRAAPDVDWIPTVSAAGLAVITRDNKILSRRRELDAVLASRARLFAIGGAAPLSTWQQLEIVVQQWDAMEAAREADGPFVYLVSRTRITRVDLGRPSGLLAYPVGRTALLCRGSSSSEDNVVPLTAEHLAHAPWLRAAR